MWLCWNPPLAGQYAHLSDCIAVVNVLRHGKQCIVRGKPVVFETGLYFILLPIVAPVISVIDTINVCHPIRM